MPREHGRLLCRIWGDKDWRARSVGAQRLYALLLSQKELNNAGVIPLMPSKWARGCDETTVEDIERALVELDRFRFVVVDRETDEVLVRTLIRNDGIAKQPQVLKNALRMAVQIESPRLRHVLAGELRRLRLAAASAVADEIDPNPAATLPEPSPNGAGTLGEPFANPSGSLNPSATLPEGCAEVCGEGEGEGVISCSGDEDFKDVPTSSAQTIIAEWIDRCPKPPPKRVVGQVARHVAELLAEGQDADDIRRGLAAWMAKGLHPATLPSVVNEVMNRSPDSGRVATADQRVHDTQALKKLYADHPGNHRQLASGERP